MKVIHYFGSGRQAHWLAQIGKSDWSAGELLYKLLESGDFFDMVGEGSEVLLLVEGDELISYCTYAKRDDIQPTTLTPWVGFVYTFPAYRGHRYVGLLFEEADRLARAEHVKELYVSTNHVGLYEKYGCTFLTTAKDLEGEWSRIYVRKVGRPDGEKDMDFAKNTQMHFLRLHEPPYDDDHVFLGNNGWPGDREGRALLAFLCHYRISGRKIPCMDAMLRALPERTNDALFFGDIPADGTADEQQLSGHNWYLRALAGCVETFGDAFALRALKSTFERLYLPALPLYDRYPLERSSFGGGVDGSICGAAQGWKFSSDVGCAFMCVDGVARYYALTGDARAYAFLEKVIGVFLRADMVARGFQTHTSLTCMRGMLSFYETTREEKYLLAARREFDRYLRHGMTLTYENFNWFGREDTWTEPCAVVDSLLLATAFYRLTREDRYRVLARRIWANGLQFCQRDNGGVGTNKCVTASQPSLRISGYEAPQCCTMRYAEALLCVHENAELFRYDPCAPVVTEPDGRRYADDRLIVRSDGETLPIFSCNSVPKDKLGVLRLDVLF